MAPIGIALVGGGIFIKEEHVPAVLACEKLSIKAIFSRSLKAAQDTASLVTVGSAPDLYSSDSGAGKEYRDLLARGDVSGVIIALPIPNQPEYIEAALAAGKHVLAEKPLAPDVASGLKLIEYYRKVGAEKGVTFGVAENFRYYPSYHYAKKEIEKLGKVTGFAASSFFLAAKEGNKWFETPWRKQPQHQGGFVFDACVHTSAALRFLLGADATPDTVVALTTQVQEHLPPLDSAYAVVRLASGALGSLSLSAGTTLSGGDIAIACAGGSVRATGVKVAVTSGGETHEEHFEKTFGVKEEVRAWAESLVAGRPDPLQAPETALGDMELLEAIFKSGEQDGAPQKLRYQH